MTEEEVLKIVDECFHMYASYYRPDAQEYAKKRINALKLSKI